MRTFLSLSLCLLQRLANAFFLPPFPLADFGNLIPVLSFEFHARRPDKGRLFLVSFCFLLHWSCAHFVATVCLPRSVTVKSVGALILIQLCSSSSTRFHVLIFPRLHSPSSSCHPIKISFSCGSNQTTGSCTGFQLFSCIINGKICPSS